MTLIQFPTKAQADANYWSSFTCQGRLTLTTGTPVTTSDVTGASTLYYTPFVGDRISIYDGTIWQTYATAEISISPSGMSNRGHYDIFAYVSGGIPTLFQGPVWASDTSRGTGAGTTELTRQNGILVNANNLSGGPNALLGRYLGTIRATGLTTMEDSGGGVTTQVGGRRWLYNHYNQVERFLQVIDTTDNWSYTTNTIRQANAAQGNRVEYIVGFAGILVEANVQGTAYLFDNNATAAKVGVGVDSTTTFSGLVPGGYNNPRGETFTTNSSAGYFTMTAHYKGYPGLGYHALNWNESGADGSCVFLGDNGGDGQQTGLIAVIRM